MKLVIVESPAKAKTIEKYLGEGFTVRASVGHVRDLPKSNKEAIAVDKGFTPHYEISPAKHDVISELKKISKKAEEVILATDPDREGEAIAWHLEQVLGLHNPKRIVFNEITKDAIRAALENPRTIDTNLREAQEARRVLDRLVGYDLSGLIWKKVRYGLSAGRVQSPALRILMEREREIRAFTPEAFWVITADTKTAAGHDITFSCIEEPKTHEAAHAIVTIAERESWKVKEIKESAAKRAPRAPFTTSTLQQAASSRLGYAPSRTMGIAQKLYEAGLITYMRTDSTSLSSQARENIADVITDTYGKDHLHTKQYATQSKSAQEAHEAVRPADVRKTTAGRTEEQKRLYSLIWARTVASQMIEAEIARTKITAHVSGIPDFTVTGSRVVREGWLRADPTARGEDVELPPVQKGDALSLIAINAEGKETQPPPRYTEARLIKELEKRGIGRPSTYAAIMRTLADRGYVTKEGRTLIPTDTGDVVSSFLEKHFARYVSDTFTAEMEDELDEIATGTRGYAKTLSDFYTPFSKEVASKEHVPKLTNLGPAPEEFTCPECGADMVYKLAKHGKFMSCAKFPDCHGARKEDGAIIEPPKEIGEPCPECGTPSARSKQVPGKLVEREGRFGMFISCDRYPKCKYIKQDTTLNSTGVACTECKDGELIERHGRFGTFYSCSHYPECKLAIKAKPTGAHCPLCNKLMMEGTKTIPERCSDKSCPNHNPHKLK